MGGTGCKKPPFPEKLRAHYMKGKPREFKQQLKKKIVLQLDRDGGRGGHTKHYSLIKGQWNLRQLHGACNWWQFTPPLLFSLNCFRLPSFNQIRTTRHRGQSSQETVAVDFTTAPLDHVPAVWKSQTLEAKAAPPSLEKRPKHSPTTPT